MSEDDVPKIIDFVSGCIGGMAGILVAQPFDVVKVILQANQSDYSPNLFKAMNQIRKDEGVLGFYKGMVSPLVGCAGLNAVLFGVQGACSHYMTKWKGVESEHDLSILDMWKAGAIAGGAQTIVSAPAEHVKIQMQVQNLNKKLYNTNYDLLRAIFKRGPLSGIAGLFRGTVVTLFREVPSYGLYFGAYEWGVRKFGRTPFVQFCSGGAAGVLCWVASYPIDVVKTKIQAQPVGQVLYKNWMACAKEVYLKQGVSVFGRGLVATIVRSFPLNGTTFLFYEVTKKFLLQQSEADEDNEAE